MVIRSRKQLWLVGLGFLAAASFSSSAFAGDVPNKDGGVVLIDQAFVKKHKFPLEIDQPGTYRLTNSLTLPTTGDTDAAFLVSAPKTNFGVTIDLNGLTLGGSGGGTGIEISTGQNVTVENGTISNFSSGVSGPNATVTVRGVRVIISQTSSGTGIFCGNGSIVSGNTVIGSGAIVTGISCTRAVISNNTVSGFGRGIDGTGSVITSNNVSNNSGTGIFAGSARIEGNTSTGNSIGIFDNGGSTVLNNTISNNSSIGIQGGVSTIEGNSVISNGVGILVPLGGGLSVLSNNNVSKNSGVGIGAVTANVTNNQVTSNTGDGVDMVSGGLVNGNVVNSNGKIGLNFNDVTTSYLNNTVGNNTTANVMNGTNRGGNLCFQGTTTTDCP